MATAVHWWVRTLDERVKEIESNPQTGGTGNTVLTGLADPTTQGANGDYYINKTTWQIFGPKTSGAWGAGTNLIGPQGQAGADGAQGPQGIQGVPGNNGAQGPQGPAGQGVPAGGTTGQVLTKTSANDYATAWQTPSGGGGGGANVKSGIVNLAAGGTANVTFTTPFQSVPHVVVSSQFNVADTSTTLGAYNVTVNGFTMKGAGNAAGNVAWIATDAGNT